GRTQYGRNRDDWGNWFGCNNPNPIFHYVLDLNYLERNPHLQPPPLRQDIRVGDSRVYPIAPIISHCDTKYRPLGAIPRFTSACGTMVYRDQLFGPEYENVTFTSEPVYNLVHARKLQPEGVSFQSLKLQEGEAEFFRSKDPWSRPAGLHVGPDGALYVADMVREVIEHPEWIDDELEKTINVRSGEELGRIYRIAPVNTPRRAFKRLDTLDTAGLVKALDSPSGWQRDLVQRMLIWRNDLSAVPLLEELATNASSATTRLHALCTLEGMNALTEDLTLRLLADPHPGVRRHAIRCLEHFECEEADPLNWHDKLKPLVHDADPFVRLQLAYSLGEFPAAWSANLLGQTLLEGQDDRNQVAAALSSLHKQNLGTVFELVQQQSPRSPLAAQVAALAVQMNQADVLSSWFTQFSSDPSTWKTLREWFLLLGSAKQDLWKRLGPENSSQLTALLENARQITRSQNESAALRTDAMRVLGHQPSLQKQDVELLLSLLDPLSAPQLQQTALETVLSIPNESIPQQLIAHWPRLSPTLRKILLDGLLARVSWTEQLLAAIQADQIQASVISTEQQQLLLQHRALPVRTQAELIFGKLESNRSPILKEYLNVVSLLDAEARNLERGQELFKKKCQSCHRLQNEGQHLGPDLTRLLNRSPEALLTAIIDPNQSVEAKYLQYQILTVEGQTWNGILKEETATSLTIALPDGKTKTIPRSELELFQASQLSLMPVGLEKDLNLDQMADLIKYLIHQTSQEQAE
ncbi:MAG: HEAT repeat domain-containing protein, partial [Planctomycetaceae bacterium]|nr:HEAT repeat domain-containing protein [Planctomycetaceae bacterium]